MLSTFSELYWDLQSPAGFSIRRPCCIHWIEEEGCTCAQKDSQDFNDIQDWQASTSVFFDLKVCRCLYRKCKSAV